MITPGDWFLVENYAGERITSYSIEVPETDEQQNVLIGEVYGPTEEDMADNARLIAAAPETLRQRDALLEACQEFVRKVDAGEARSTRSYKQLKAAIAMGEKT